MGFIALHLIGGKYEPDYYITYETYVYHNVKSTKIEDHRHRPGCIAIQFARPLTVSLGLNTSTSLTDHLFADNYEGDSDDEECEILLASHNSLPNWTISHFQGERGPTI